MLPLIKVEIEEVNNGYIARKYTVLGDEIRVYKDFLEMINWIALVFNEKTPDEEIVRISTKDKEVK